jgi:hypothetical protein
MISFRRERFSEDEYIHNVYVYPWTDEGERAMYEDAAALEAVGFRVVSNYAVCDSDHAKRDAEIYSTEE